jgi:hypothetical protein
MDHMLTAVDRAFDSDAIEEQEHGILLRCPHGRCHRVCSVPIDVETGVFVPQTLYVVHPFREASCSMFDLLIIEHEKCSQ